MTCTRAGLVYDPIFLRHQGPPEHPERPDRLRSCVNALKEANLWERFSLLPSRPLEREEALLLHRASYFDFLVEKARGHEGWLDYETFHSVDSIEAALIAAGTTIDLTMAVARGEYASGLALVRPPGHHAQADAAAGYCILANVALAAKTAQLASQRVAIVDFDVHHGNGTQALLYEEADILFISLHRFGGEFYPKSGAATEVGQGPGLGKTINLPLSAGAGNQIYHQVFLEKVGPALLSFRPSIILVSAGFDAHAQDPLGGMAVTEEGFAIWAHLLRRWANELCAGRLVVVLEGGYDLTGVASGVAAFAQELLS